MGVLSWCWRGPWRQALRDLRKGLEMLRRRKHGTTGRLALPHQHRQKGEIAETVRSAPGRDPRMARFIRILRAVASVGCCRDQNGATGAGPLTYLFVYHTSYDERRSWLEGPFKPLPRCRPAIRNTPPAPRVRP